MNKKTFFTEEFYQSPIITMDILNELIKDRDNIVELDMYTSGEFLTLVVHENENTKKILAVIISDLDQYKEFNNEMFVNNCGIGLSALQIEHCIAFDGDDEIVYDSDENEFISRGMKENDE